MLQEDDEIILPDGSHAIVLQIEREDEQTTITYLSKENRDFGVKYVTTIQTKFEKELLP